MEIQFHSHHAVISDRLRARAERAVTKIGKRLGRAVDATVRFERDNGLCRVELVVHAAGHRNLVGQATGKYYGPALAIAVNKLEAQLPKKDTPKTRSRAAARTRRVPSTALS